MLVITYSSGYIQKILDNGGCPGAVKEIVMTLLESQFEGLVKVLSVHDLKRRGPSKVRLVSYLEAVCNRDDLFVVPCFFEHVSTVLVIVNCEKYGVQDCPLSV